MAPRNPALGLQKTGEEGSSLCRSIEAVVSTALGIEIAELRTEDRGRAAVAHARQTAMYLAHVHFGLTLSQVGRNFGRDRTTVAHACARIEDSRDDPIVDTILSCLEFALERWRRSFLAVGGF
jgi:chromosomal replication initiation ATPase DnaA